MALPADFRPLRILVAEDNPVNRRLVTAVLELRGHTLVLAANGRDALAAWESSAFDVVLTDIHMPDMNGFEVAAAIRARETSPVPIIALTASAQDGDDRRCLAAGMDACLAKPVSSEALIALVESLASRRGAPPQPGPPGALDAGLRRTLTRLFVADAARLGDEIRSAIACRDAAALQAAAHRLRGSAGYFAARRACELAARLEALGRAGDFAEPTGRLARELADELARLERALPAGGE
jgi:CheY-like chemotaxis protein/HPt (histidine-containing phosphotransfer) domain-containing protein